MQPGADSLNVATAAAIAFRVPQPTGMSAVIRPSSTSMRRVSEIASSRARSWVTSSNVPAVALERRFELLDRGQVEMVRRLVEHEAVDALGAEQRERRPCALAGRERVGGPGDVFGAQTELREQRPRRARHQRARGLEAGEERRISGERGAGLVELADDHARPEPRSPASSGRRPMTASSSVVLPLPFAPTIATRSPYSIWRSIGPRTKSPLRTIAPARRDDGAAAGRGRDLHAQIPALPRLVDRVRLEPRERAIGDLGLGRDVLAAVAPELADVLVVLARLLQLRLALHRPLALALRPVAQLAALRAVVGVLLLGVTAGGRVLVEIRLPSTGVLGCRVLVLVELQHRRDRAVEERAIVRHDDGAAGQLVVQEPFQSLETGEVEVVGGLVEQEHVEAGEHDRGEARARACPPDNDGMSRSSTRVGRPRSAHTAPSRASKSAAPSGEVALERLGVGVVGARVLSASAADALSSARSARATPVRRARYAPFRPRAVRALAGGNPRSRSAV